MSYRKKALLGLLAVATATLIGVFALGCTSSKSAAGSTTTVSSEKKAPDFTVKSISGETFSLSSHKGKPIVLNFAASWCGPCELEAPVLAKVYEKYKDRVVFLGLAVKDKEEDQKAFAQKHGLTFPIGLDLDGEISYVYIKAGRIPVGAIPTTFFIDKEGLIRSYFIGPLTEQTFEQKLKSILPADSQSTTKAP